MKPMHVSNNVANREGGDQAARWEISVRTLEMMDKAVKNLKEGKVSEPVDVLELVSSRM